MRQFRIIPTFLSVIVFCISCAVHEYPEVPETTLYRLQLHYETDLPVWNLDYDLQYGVTSKGEAVTKSVREEGQMRYIIRTYPQTKKSRSADGYIQEFVFRKNISKGYDAVFDLDIIPGEYRLMVWSDMSEGPDSAPYYNHRDFSQIVIDGEHKGNTDYRDAFRGYLDISVDPTTIEKDTDTLTVEMIRPLAKFEFISDDLDDFVATELNKAMEADTKTINVDDYKVRIIYPGYMPNTFNMFSDKPVNSALGVSFNSRITQLNETDASMGFDYVFINGKQSAVTVQMAIDNKEGKQISLTQPVNVPLKRGYHTILKGSFLMQKSSGGVAIDPDFDGNFNVPLL